MGRILASLVVAVTYFVQQIVVFGFYFINLLVFRAYFIEFDGAAMASEC